VYKNGRISKGNASIFSNDEGASYAIKKNFRGVPSNLDFEVCFDFFCYNIFCVLLNSYYKRLYNVEQLLMFCSLHLSAMKCLIILMENVNYFSKK
jgi:hypothetical protein